MKKFFLLIVLLMSLAIVPVLAQSTCDAALAGAFTRTERCLAKVDKTFCKGCKAGWVHQCRMSESIVPGWMPLRPCLRGELRTAEAGHDAVRAMAGLVGSQSNMLARAEVVAAENARDHQENRQMVAGVVSRNARDMEQRRALFDRIKQEKHDQELRQLAEMQAYREARQAEVDAMNAQEDVRRQQWLESQRQQEETRLAAAMQHQQAQSQDAQQRQQAASRAQQEARRRQQAAASQTVSFDHRNFEEYDHDHRLPLGIPSKTYWVEFTNTGSATLFCSAKISGDQAIHGGSTCVRAEDCVARRSVTGGGIVVPGQRRIVAGLTYYQGRGSYVPHCRRASM